MFGNSVLRLEKDWKFLVDIGRPLFETRENLTMLLMIWGPLFETQESLSRLIEASKPAINTWLRFGTTVQDTGRLIKVGRSSYANLGNLSRCGKGSEPTVQYWGKLCKAGKGSCRCLEASFYDLSRLVEVRNFALRFKKASKACWCSKATVWDLESSGRDSGGFWKSPFET